MNDVRVTRPDNRVYEDPRIAAGYAFGRPPVHRRIADIIGRHLRIAAPLERALDVGCGAGVSTAALAPLARTVVGVEPVLAMLAHHSAVAPDAAFAAGEAERLPFADGSFNLITAAGSINYTDRNLFLPEAERLLTPGGVMVIYDFPPGRRIVGSDRLDQWYRTFERRYPPQPGYALDVRTIDFEQCGLRLGAYEEMDIPVPMTLESYLRYAMSETNVQLAIVGGLAEEEIGDWCRGTLTPVFGSESQAVLFSAYVAYVFRLKAEAT